MWNQSLQTHAKMYQIYVEWVYTVGLVVGRPPEFPSSTGGKTSGIPVKGSIGGIKTKLNFNAEFGYYIELLGK